MTHGASSLDKDIMMLIYVAVDSCFLLFSVALCCSVLLFYCFLKYIRIKGELLPTIMSSLAQEESRSILLNVTWGQRKRFADGKATAPFSVFLGYDRGENGEFVINPEQAEIVKIIYDAAVIRYEATKAEREKVAADIRQRSIRRREFERFITELEKLPIAVSEFDETLWGSLVEYVTVGKDKTMVLTRLGGTEIGA